MGYMMPLNNNKSVALNDHDGRRRALHNDAWIAFLGWLPFRLSGLVG
jgi:hypothetical protein